jgi:hypothetical protein
VVVVVVVANGAVAVVVGVSRKASTGSPGSVWADSINVRVAADSIIEGNGARHHDLAQASATT